MLVHPNLHLMPQLLNARELPQLSLDRSACDDVVLELSLSEDSGDQEPSLPSFQGEEARSQPQLTPSIAAIVQEKTGDEKECVATVEDDETKPPERGESPLLQTSISRLLSALPSEAKDALILKLFENDKALNISVLSF